MELFKNVPLNVQFDLDPDYSLAMSLILYDFPEENVEFLLHCGKIQNHPEKMASSLSN